jgi:hypothetical protein
LESLNSEVWAKSKLGNNNKKSKIFFNNASHP